VPPPSATAGRNILASYFAGWPDAAGEDMCLLGYGQYALILYEDGQLVIRTSEGYREAQLSQLEVDELLGRIEDTGFLQVEGDGSQRELDPVYTVPEGFLPPDGFPYDDITVLEKRVQVYTPLLEYLIPEVRSARDILLGYSPRSTVPFVPRSLELWINGAEAEEPPEGIHPTPLPGVMEWPRDLLPLQSLHLGEGLARVTLEGSPALMELFPTLPSTRVVTEEGREYLVGACPLLP
jgi:hypothetical protein